MLEVMRDILQSRYQRSNVAHNQLARTSLSQHIEFSFGATFLVFAIKSDHNFDRDFRFFLESGQNKDNFKLNSQDLNNT